MSALISHDDALALFGRRCARCKRGGHKKADCPDNAPPPARVSPAPSPVPTEEPPESAVAPRAEPAQPTTPASDDVDVLRRRLCHLEAESDAWQRRAGELEGLLEQQDAELAKARAHTDRARELEGQVWQKGRAIAKGWRAEDEAALSALFARAGVRFSPTRKGHLAAVEILVVRLEALSRPAPEPPADVTPPAPAGAQLVRRTSAPAGSGGRRQALSPEEPPDPPSRPGQEPPEAPPSRPAPRDDSVAAPAPAEPSPELLTDPDLEALADELLEDEALEVEPSAWDPEEEPSRLPERASALSNEGRARVQAGAFDARERDRMLGGFYIDLPEADIGTQGREGDDAVDAERPTPAQKRSPWACPCGFSTFSGRAVVLHRESCSQAPAKGVRTVAADPAIPGPTAQATSTREQRRSRRKREIHARTISVKRLAKRELEIGRMLYPERIEHLRPKTRGECWDGPRPCPFVSCHHHLYLDVSARTGAIKLNFPDLEPDELAESCALDVADGGGRTLEDVGAILNLTRERIRQVEVKALRLMEERGAALREHADGDRRVVRLAVIREHDGEDESGEPDDDLDREDDSDGEVGVSISPQRHSYEAAE